VRIAEGKRSNKALARGLGGITEEGSLLDIHVRFGRTRERRVYTIDGDRHQWDHGNCSRFGDDQKSALSRAGSKRFPAPSSPR